MWRAMTPSKPLPFHIRSWSAWAPGRETEAAWRRWAGVPREGDDAEPAAAPLLLRRRVGALGQKALRAAWALPESATARMVFCSRHGEFGRTLSILDALANSVEVSPADFTLSVHNALAGLLSIARANKQGHTTIAAGTESFGFGMMEALASLAESPDEPVLVVWFDEPLPPPFDAFKPDYVEPSALALCLTSGQGFSLTTAPSANAPLGAEPAIHAFMRVLLGAAPEAIVISEQLAWHWRRDDAAD
jgi:hypothetical protein